MMSDREVWLKAWDVVRTHGALESAPVVPRCSTYLAMILTTLIGRALLRLSMRSTKGCCNSVA